MPLSNRIDTILKSRFSAGLPAALVFCAVASCDETQRVEQKSYDYLITSGDLYTGAAQKDSHIADIAVHDGRIVFIGDAVSAGVTATNEINAGGFIVAPGFIDPHTHALDDLLSSDKSQNVNYLTQGVTTVFVGNDGDGPVEIAETLGAVQANKIGTNVAMFTGHGSIRKAVLGNEDRAPTAKEMELMRDMVRDAMSEGAFGLSAGLYYAPASYAETDELIELAKEAAAFDGVYETHLRDESSYSIGLLAAVEEALTIGRESGAAVHLAHIKALGVDVWGQSAEVVAMIESASENGQEVTADQYPWRASGTHVSNALIPNWAKEGSQTKFHQRLRAPEYQDRLRVEIEENLRKRGGPEALLIVAGRDEDTGKTLAEVAIARNIDPVTAAIEIVLDGDARVASFNMNESDIETFMRQSWVMTSSDGTEGHPRKYASFPRKYAEYVVRREVLSLREFIRRSTGLAADTFGLCDRGYLKVGYAADIVIFDPATFSDVANFSEPRRLSTGIEFLFVNGEPVIDNKGIKSIYAGKPIRRKSCAE